MADDDAKRGAIAAVRRPDAGHREPHAEREPVEGARECGGDLVVRLVQVEGVERERGAGEHDQRHRVGPNGHLLRRQTGDQKCIDRKQRVEGHLHAQGPRRRDAQIEGLLLVDLAERRERSTSCRGVTPTSKKTTDHRQRRTNRRGRSSRAAAGRSRGRPAIRCRANGQPRTGGRAGIRRSERRCRHRASPPRARSPRTSRPFPRPRPVRATKTHSAAIARSESNRGKRGFPGGGATAAGTSAGPSGSFGPDASRIRSPSALSAAPRRDSISRAPSLERRWPRSGTCAFSGPRASGVGRVPGPSPRGHAGCSARIRDVERLWTP